MGPGSPRVTPRSGEGPKRTEKHMEIDREPSEMVESGQTGCSNPWRQEQSRELGKLLPETLRSPGVAAMEHRGEHRVNPGSA